MFEIGINLLALYLHIQQPYIDHYQALPSYQYGPDVFHITPYKPYLERTNPYPPVQNIRIPYRHADGHNRVRYC